MKRLYVFDLDRTVINSDHRTPYDKDGNLILSEYKKLAVRENIMRDTLYPLANFMRRKIKEGRDFVAICTAREMGFWDWQFLTVNGMRPNLCMSRNKIDKSHYFMPDAAYKVEHLQRLMTGEHASAHKIMFDDNLAVVRAVQELPGFTVVPVFNV
jgi:hypothetical protein